MNVFTFFWIAATLEEVEEEVFRASIDVEVSRVDTTCRRGLGRVPLEKRYTNFTVGSQNLVFLTLTW